MMSLRYNFTHRGVQRVEFSTNGFKRIMPDFSLVCKLQTGLYWKWVYIEQNIQIKGLYEN